MKKGDLVRIVDTKSSAFGEEWVVYKVSEFFDNTKVNIVNKEGTSTITVQSDSIELVKEITSEEYNKNQAIEDARRLLNSEGFVVRPRRPEGGIEEAKALLSKEGFEVLTQSEFLERFPMANKGRSQ